MTPKEKAKELVDKLTGAGFTKIPQSRLKVLAGKRCAIIAVDEIIKSEPLSPDFSIYKVGHENRFDTPNDYWQKVKEEIGIYDI